MQRALRSGMMTAFSLHQSLRLPVPDSAWDIPVIQLKAMTKDVSVCTHTRVVVDWEVLNAVGPGVVLVGLDVHHVALPAHVGVRVGEVKPVTGHYQVATRPPRLKKKSCLLFFLKFSQPTLKRATHLRVFLAIWTVMF